MSRSPSYWEWQELLANGNARLKRAMLAWSAKERKESDMSVRVEKIEPKPERTPPAYFQIKGISIGQGRDSLSGEPFPFCLSESEARAIWEGLSEHFTGNHNWTLQLHNEIAKKDAEIARLKALGSVNKDQEIAFLDREIASLREKNRLQLKLLDEQLAEVGRLRGWLEKIKSWMGGSSLITRALAGDKVPE